MSDFICLNCGTDEGSPSHEGTTDWWWWMLEYGRVGPFHEPACLYLFRYKEANNRFSIPEVNRLLFQRERLIDDIRQQREVKA